MDLDTNRTAKDKLLDNGIDEDVSLFEEDVFVDSLIGTVMMPGIRAVYDFNKMVDDYVNRYHVTPDEAADYICYNLERGIGYSCDPGSPIIVDTFLF